MEEVRWDWIFEAVKADEGVVTFMKIGKRETDCSRLKLWPT